MVEKLKKMESPDRKVAAGFGVGSIGTIITWTINEFTSVTIPAETALAFATIIYAAVQYYVPNKS